MKAKALATGVALLSLAVCLVPTRLSAASLTLNPSRGTVGTEVTIPAICSYGEGSYYVYWEEADQLLAQGEIDEGCISITFTVPEAARGKHKVTMKVGDDSFWNEFTIVPSISLSANRGTVGSNLAVTGKGFGSNESGITITYDDSPIETGVTASSKGTWQSTFEVPASSRGEHIIDAGGATPATEVDD